VLGEQEFDGEARAALLEGIQQLARAWAVEHRLPQPGSVDDALLPPLAMHWKDSLAPVRQFVADTTQPWRTAGDILAKLCL
jgi:hypothetical protein